MNGCCTPPCCVSAACWMRRARSGARSLASVPIWPPRKAWRAEVGFALPEASASSARAVALGLSLTLLLSVAMPWLASGLDARLLDGGFALNRQLWPQPVAHDVVVVG